MIPDYPKLKAKLHELLTIGMGSGQFPETPMLALTSRHMIHEGNKSILIRNETEIVKNTTKESRAEVVIDKVEESSLKLKKVYEKFQEAARQISIDQEKYMIEEISRITKEIGNVVDTKGKPSPEKFLEMLEKIQIDFNPDGSARFPTMFTGNKLFDQMKEVFEKMDKEPFKTKFEVIMRKKKQEYNARENNRKLVD